MESFVAYAEKNPVELLLISAEAMCHEVGELDIGKIVILTEGSTPKELENYTGVYKYQASSDVVREVMACYGAEKAIFPVQLPVLKKTTEVLGVYSPLGGCLQTCFALTLAQILGKEKNVLYLNLEEYAGFEKLMQKKFSHTLSDLLYFAKQNDPHALLMPVDALFSKYPPLIVELSQAEKLRHGAQVKDWQFQPGTYRVYAEDGEFLLLGRVEGGVLTTIKSFFEVNTLGT